MVPAGVTSAVFTLDGAVGGTFTPFGGAAGGTGGAGGRVQATVALTPGATLNMRVGGKGSNGFFAQGTGTATAQGGFNGGGTNTYDCPEGCQVLPAGVSNVTVTDGVQSGNGLITITYTTPTAVTFASAGATRTAKGVLIRWSTGTEADLLGFQVFRSRERAWRRLNRPLIRAKGSVSGASYRYVDKTARRGFGYRYRARAVNRDGTTAWVGPVRST